MHTPRKAIAFSLLGLDMLLALNVAMVADDIAADPYRALSLTQTGSSAAHPFRLEIALAYEHRPITDVSSGGAMKMRI